MLYIIKKFNDESGEIETVFMTSEEIKNREKELKIKQKELKKKQKELEAKLKVLSKQIIDLEKTKDTS